MMTEAQGKPCIICVAITGSVPTKENNPAVPITVPEQIESTQEAFEAGATIAHCHVRNDDQTPTSDPEKSPDARWTCTRPNITAPTTSTRGICASR